MSTLCVMRGYNNIGGMTGKLLRQLRAWLATPGVVASHICSAAATAQNGCRVHMPFLPGCAVRHGRRTLCGYRVQGWDPE